MLLRYLAEQRWAGRALGRRVGWRVGLHDDCCGAEVAGQQRSSPWPTVALQPDPTASCCRGLLLSWLHGANVAAPQCTHTCTRARKGRGRVRASSGGRRRHEASGGVRRWARGVGAGRGAAAAERSRALSLEKMSQLNSARADGGTPRNTLRAHTRPHVGGGSGTGPGAISPPHKHTYTSVNKQQRTTRGR